MTLPQFAGGAPLTPASPSEVASDEEYWRRVAAEFRVPAVVTNLENGYWGVMARPVLEAYIANTERVNSEGVYYIRNAYAKDLE